MENESRYCQLNLRGERDGKMYAGGLAIPLNVRSKNFGGFAEVIKPEALTQQMIERSDPIVFWGHDKTKVLGRYSAGTMRFWRSTEKVNGELIDGWFYEFEIPDTSYGQDALVSIQRRDVTGSSFGFIIDPSKNENAVTWKELPDEKMWLREVNEIHELFDFSPVARPAYGINTTVALRSLEEFRNLHTQTNKEQGGYKPESANFHFLNKIKARHENS